MSAAGIARRSQHVVSLMVLVEWELEELLPACSGLRRQSTLRRDVPASC